MNGRLFEALLAACLIGGSLLSPMAAATNEIAAELPPAAEAKWRIKLPLDGLVNYRGVANFDGAGTGTASMMYPASNAGGLLAAVITHGFLVSSSKDEQKKKIQADADKVLLPYRTVIDTFNSRELIQRAARKSSSRISEKFIENAADSSREMFIESLPFFSLTQDQTAIILNNIIVVHLPGNKPETDYRKTIRIVSTAQNASDPVAFWTASDGERLKDESAQLVAESIDIALSDAVASLNSNDVPYQTVRYREGRTEKVERAQVLGNRCDRLLIKTLRDTLMLVPTSQPTTTPSSEKRCVSGTVTAELGKSS